MRGGGGYSDFHVSTAANNKREIPVKIEDVELFVEFMRWGLKTANEKGGAGYLDARRECQKFLLSKIEELCFPS